MATDPRLDLPASVMIKKMPDGDLVMSVNDLKEIAEIEDTIPVGIYTLTETVWMQCQASQVEAP